MGKRRKIFLLYWRFPATALGDNDVIARHLEGNVKGPRGTTDRYRDVETVSGDRRQSWL
jgi:hypothetical protein